MKKDIKSRDDIVLLVDSFYDKVKADDSIGYIFQNIIGADWSQHLPIMYQFWETILLNKPGYSGNPVKKHIEVDQKEPLEEAHYTRWLELWRKTTDELFEGENADEIKNRAYLMMNLIKIKVELARLGKGLV